MKCFILMKAIIKKYTSFISSGSLFSSLDTISNVRSNSFADILFVINLADLLSKHDVLPLVTNFFLIMQQT